MIQYNKNLPLFSLHIPKMAGNSLTYVLSRWYNVNSFVNINNHPRLFKLLTPFNIDFLIQRLNKSALWFHYKNHQFNVFPRVPPFDKKYGIFLNTNLPTCIHGHFDHLVDGKSLFDYYPNANQFITFLRDPLEAHVSFYNYHLQLLKNGLSWNGEKILNSKPFNIELDDWVAKANFFQLRFLPWQITLDNYKEIVHSNFVHIGIAENMQTSVDLLAEKLHFQTIKVPKLNTTDSKEYPGTKAIASFKQKNELAYRIYDLALNLNRLD